MSGGHFDYKQDVLNEIYSRIEEILAKEEECKNKNPNEEEYYYSLGLEDKHVLMFKEAMLSLRKSEIMVQRIDWLVSGDDDIKTFDERWDACLSQDGNLNRLNEEIAELSRKINYEDGDKR